MRGSLDYWVCQSCARLLVLGMIVSPIFSTLGTAAKAIGELSFQRMERHSCRVRIGEKLRRLLADTADPLEIARFDARTEE